MEIFVVFGIVCIVYVMLMFFDFFFKSCMMLPYLEFLKRFGISVRFFRLQFYTTGMNRTILKCTSRMPSLYRNSFKLGCYITMILFPIATILIVQSLFSVSSLTTSNGNAQAVMQSEDFARLEILLPGVNLPLNQIGYYIAALFICSVVHEAGHAISAVLEDVPVIGFGLQLMFVIPIAFTEVDSDHFQSAKVWKKLKIYCAGIWNNMLLAGFSYILLLLLPLLLHPIYETNEAVFITEIKQKAAIKGENGLYTGDRITQVNGCQVSNEDEWIKCLKDAIRHHPAYCVSEDFVHENEESIHEVERHKEHVSCCPSNPTLNCFENFDEERLPQYVCLNIRNTVEHSKGYCHKSICPEHTSCVKPILANTSTIIHMKRKNRVKDLVFYGHPYYDVLRNVEISEFTPKTKIFEPWFGDAIALMLKYLTVFSSGLAIVNVVPCYGLDGQFIISAIISTLPSRHFNKGRKELISCAINLVGSATLFFAILKIIVTTFSR